MKQLKALLLMGLAIVSYEAVYAQSSNTKAKTGNAAVAAIVFYCPMKCEGEKTYKKASKCPECGMNLKAKPAEVAKLSYQCPMKCEGEKTYTKEGKCPKCNMELKKIKTDKVKESHDGHNHP